MGDLAELARRVEEADGPDPKLDAEIMALFYRRGWAKIGVYDSAKGRQIKSRVWKDRDSGAWVSTHPKQFTASLDAAHALVSEKLPGWAWSVGNLTAGAQAYLMPRPGAEMIAGRATTPALALTAALLKALDHA